MYSCQCRAGTSCYDSRQAWVGTLSLESFPLRGNVPQKLEIVGITLYREIHVHQWRIIYEALESLVHAHWVFDSRHDVAGGVPALANQERCRSCTDGVLLSSRFGHQKPPVASYVHLSSWPSFPNPFLFVVV